MEEFKNQQSEYYKFLEEDNLDDLQKEKAFAKNKETNDQERSSFFGRWLATDNTKSKRSSPQISRGIPRYKELSSGNGTPRGTPRTLDYKDLWGKNSDR